MSDPNHSLNYLKKISTDWTLFLDRDGVINKKIDNDYVRNLDQFEILPGVLDALVHFSKIFGRIVVVTNQQGVGKKLMTGEDVELIHSNFLEQLENHGGRIDAFYYAPQLVAEKSEMRKPNIGMALKAREDFPEIDFNKSVMVGDSISDMEFAKNVGMPRIFLSNKTSKEELNCVSSLQEFAQMI